MDSKPFRDYRDYLDERFGGPVQKLTVDAGFTCPNRDGTKGRGGCIYCNNRSFSPDIAKAMPLREQIAAARDFYARKHPAAKYLVYFQSFTNTYAPADRLLSLYREALAEDDVAGIVIATRPDCIDSNLLCALSELNRHKRVIIEYGAESSHDSTLLTINRCHTWADTVRAAEMTREARLDFGLHFIFGLPGETREMMLETVDRINRLHPDIVKFHQLQVIRGTRLATMLEAGKIEIPRFTLDEYIDLCIDVIRRLDHSIAIERFISTAPAEMLIHPRWGLKPSQFMQRLISRLTLRPANAVCRPEATARF